MTRINLTLLLERGTPDIKAIPAAGLTDRCNLVSFGLIVVGPALVRIVSVSYTFLLYSLFSFFRNSHLVSYLTPAVLTSSVLGDG